MKLGYLMKASLAAAACAVLMSSSLAGAAETAEAGFQAGTSEAAKDYETLVVGSTTALTGAFFTDMWGNAAADLDVRSLIHGYGLIRWNAADGIFEADPSVISGIKGTQDGEGNRTFTISLYSDLKYSNGDPITAADYAFAILLTASPQVEEIGGRIGKASFVVGYDEYRSGEADRLKGLRILSERELAVTIRSDYLPYFYELGLLNFSPAPISVIAPGCSVKDDGDGVYISRPDGGTGLDAQTLRQTILDENTGYLSHPGVVSGPYMLTSFDGQEAYFEINPAYKGDAKGNKPSIEHVVYRLVTNDTMVDEMADHKVDLLNRICAAETVQEGIALVSGGDEYAMSSYPRSGMSFITFCGENGPAASVNVRQAVAFCLDKEAVTKGYEGTLGVPMDCYTGLGQWMYQAEAEEYGASLDGIHTYGAGGDAEETIAQAAALLEADGWTLGESGAAYDPASDTVRYRRAGDGLEKLSLTLVTPQGSKIGELLEENLCAIAREAGMEIVITEEEMGTLLAMYYGQTERSCDMMFLATNFDMVFDPAESFTEEEGHQCWKDSHIPADELYRLAVELRRTSPGDLAAYYKKWVAFQEEFTQVLPLIPVYSNVYFDFYTEALKGYEPSENVTWPTGIVDASLSDG